MKLIHACNILRTSIVHMQVINNGIEFNNTTWLMYSLTTIRILFTKALNFENVNL